MLLTDLQQLHHLGGYLNGTTRDTTTPTLGALVCIGVLAQALDLRAPLPVPHAYGMAAWFAALVVLTLLMIVLLHLVRPRHPDAPPRGLGTSYDRAIPSLFVAYLGVVLARYCAASCYAGTGGLGTMIFAAIGALVALAGLAAAIHNVLRRF